MLGSNQGILRCNNTCNYHFLLFVLFFLDLVLLSNNRRLVLRIMWWLASVRWRLLRRSRGNLLLGLSCYWREACLLNIWRTRLSLLLHIEESIVILLLWVCLPWGWMRLLSHCTRRTELCHGTSLHWVYPWILLSPHATVFTLESLRRWHDLCCFSIGLVLPIYWLISFHVYVYRAPHQTRKLLAHRMLIVWHLDYLTHLVLTFLQSLAHLLPVAFQTRD